MKYSIIIPTLNERDNIIHLVNGVLKIINRFSYEAEIIVVDDNSTDNTVEKLIEKFPKKPYLKIYKRIGKRGLATAILYGIKKAKGSIIIGMDADFNHPPTLIPKLIQQLETNDLVVASRFIKDGDMSNSWRYFPTLIFNLFLKYILNFPTLDNTSGYYAIRKDILFQLPIDFIYQGYGEYHLRLMYYSRKRLLQIKEIPVKYGQRRYGKSKSKLIKNFFIYLWTAITLNTNLKKINI